MSHESARPVPTPPPPSADRPVEPIAELDRLAGLGDLPLAEHVAVYDAIHRALADQLSAAET